MKMIAAALCVALASPAFAGEIFGTIKEGGKTVAEGVKVEVTCGAKTYTGATNKFGSYRVVAEEQGKCTLAVVVGAEKPSLEIHSFEDSVRYNLVLEKKDGKLTVRSE